MTVKPQPPVMNSMQTPFVQVKNLTAFYKNDHQKDQILFKNTSFELYSGRFYGLSARNGTGKTSLCQFILGLKTPQALTLKIGTVGFELARRRKWRALLRTDVFYYPTRFGDEDQELLRPFLIRNLINLKRTNPEHVLQTCRILNLSFDTLVQTKKRPLAQLMIFLALSGPWKLIILDEPVFDGFSKQQLDQVMTLFQNKAHQFQSCVFLVSHRQDLFKNCDTVLTINNHQVVPLARLKKDNTDSSQTLRSWRQEKTQINNAPPLFVVQNIPTPYLDVEAMIQKTRTLRLYQGERVLFSTTEELGFYDWLSKRLIEILANIKPNKHTVSQFFWQGQEIFPQNTLSRKLLRHQITLLSSPAETFGLDVQFEGFFRQFFSANQIEDGQKQLDFLMKTMFLPPETLKRNLRHVSAGQGQKFNLCVALLRGSPLMFLKNPMLGLDAQSKHVIAHELDRLREKGCCLVIASEEVGD